MEEKERVLQQWPHAKASFLKGYGYRIMDYTPPVKSRLAPLLSAFAHKTEEGAWAEASRKLLVAGRVKP